MRLIVLTVAAAVLTGAGLFIYMHRQWDGQGRFTVWSWKSGNIQIMSVDPEAKNEGISINLPENLEIETVGGRGKIPAGVIKEAEKKWGDKWVTDSLADYLGVTIAGNADKLNWWDKWQWWRLSRNATWKSIDLEKSGLVDIFQAPDKTLLRLNSDWRSGISGWLASKALEKEGANVTIINSVNADGLGSHAARWLETAGMKVTMITESDSSVDQCLAETNKETAGGISFRWIAKTYDCKVNIVADPVSEIKLTLGRGYLKWWTGD